MDVRAIECLNGAENIQGTRETMGEDGSVRDGIVGFCKPHLAHLRVNMWGKGWLMG